MSASYTLKLKNVSRQGRTPQQRREEIARKAAAVSRDWSAAERAQRAETARQMQRRLFASIASAGQHLQSVA